MKKGGGFTILELLIATTILAALIYVGSTAFSLFTSRWGLREDQFQRAFEGTRGTLALMEFLQSIYPLAVPDESGIPRVYFEGTENGFITTRLIDSGDRVQEEVIRLSVRQTDDGSVNLHLERAPLDGTGLQVTTQTPDFHPAIPILTTMDDLRFRYFGWESATVRSSQGEPGVPEAAPQWWDRFNALSAELMPSALALDMAVGDNTKTLLVPLPALDSSRLINPEDGL